MKNLILILLLFTCWISNAQSLKLYEELRQQQIPSAGAGCNPSVTVNLPTSGSGTTQTDCYGTLKDPSGNSNYTINNDGSITITPDHPDTTHVAVTFTAFDLELNYDYVKLYDGNSTSASLIGQYTGSSLPNGGAAINSTGGSITVRFESDFWDTSDTGFVLTWSYMTS